MKRCTRRGPALGGTAAEGPRSKVVRCRSRVSIWPTLRTARHHRDKGALTTQGFEVGLLTDRVRSRGIVLVRNAVSPQRRRFTIGHELGHFLMPSHVPDEGPLPVLAARHGDAQPQGRRPAGEDGSRGEPGFGAHPDAAAEAEGRDRQSRAEHRTHAFPRDEVRREQGRDGSGISRIPFSDDRLGRRSRRQGECDLPQPSQISLHHRAPRQASSRAFRLLSQGIAAWRAERHRRAPPEQLNRRRTWASGSNDEEQVYLQANVFALIMLWYESPDDPDFDEDGERTSKERLKLRQARFS